MTRHEADLSIDVNMLVRRPPDEVYEAFADPEGIRRFWLASSSARLERGAEVHWRFKVVGAETDVNVIEALPGELLDLRWDGGQPLRLTFDRREEGTLVGVMVSEFADCATAIESMSGFTLVLASLKVWLEHGIEGELQYDKFPEADFVDR